MRGHRFKGTFSASIPLGVVVAAAFSSLAWPGSGIWQSGGPYGSLPVYSVPLALDPTNGNVYVGGGAGVFKSADGGLNWFPTSVGLAFPAVRSLAIAPSDPTRLYAGTGFRGVFRSTDGGSTWVPAGGLAQGITALAVDPTTPSRVFAATYGGGVFRSLDSGDTWTSVNGGLTSLVVQAVVFDPLATSTLYLGTIGGLFKTTNAGVSWVGLDPNNIRALAIDPSRPDIVYAASYAAGVLKSTNAGGTWSRANNGLTNLDLYSVAVDPATPSTLYVGTYGGGVFKSTTSGASWGAASSGMPPSQVIALAVDPRTPRMVFAGTDSGIYRSTDGTATWATANDGLNRLDIPAIALDPATPTTVYAGTLYSGQHPGGLMKSTDGGGTWTLTTTGLVFNVHAIAIDPVTPSTLYIGIDYGTGGSLFKSTNGALGWTQPNTGLPTSVVISALAIDPQTPTTLYAATNQGAYRSTNAGGSWIPSGLSSTNLTALAIDPVNPSVLYACSYTGFFKSIDASGTWAAASNGLTSLDTRAVAIDPVSPAILYVATSDGVFKSVNAGGSWTATGLIGVSIQALTVHSGPPATVYASASGYPAPVVGLFMSTDGGTTWVPDTGPPVPWIRALAVNPAGTTVHAGTAAGAWQRRSSSGVFHTVNPCRLVDTRTIDAPALGAGTTRAFVLVGRCGVPPEATSLSINVTVTGATSDGHLRLYPASNPRPLTSILNFAVGQTRANSAVSLLGPAGDLAIFAGQPAGVVDVIVDVNGYFR